MNQILKPNFPPQFTRRLKLMIYVLLVIAVLGIAYRIIAYIQLRHATEQQAVLAVATTKAVKGPADEELILPGNVQAWHDATIYARTNGYIVNWMVDIGAHVKAGDLLAEITAPEVDAQLRQAEADLKTAEANNELAQTTARRWLNLLKTNSVSKQETDEKVSDAKARAAIVVSTKATRDRLRDLVGFQQVTAPFDGVIMSRTTDIGRLINAGSGTVPLFRIVQSNQLRVYVRVPEYFSRNIKPGLVAQLSFNEHAGKIYPAKLLDTAKAIDLNSRTLLVQFVIDNPNNELLAGSYTQVHLLLPAKQNIVRLPVNTLIFRAKGLQVATIDGDSKAILKSIMIGRDFGDFVEVVSGVAPGESVILNPPDALISGQVVNIVSSDAGNKDAKA